VRSALAGVLAAASFARASVPAPPPPLGPLPFLPSVARVRVEPASERLLVVEEVLMPRGDWRGGDLDLYVAFGSPGVPHAFDARLVPVSDGALAPAEEDAGEPVAFDRAPRCPRDAHVLLGRAQMAGAVVHLREGAFRHALRPGGMAALRLRALLPLPAADASGAREVVVRLGANGNIPLTLGRLQMAGAAAAAARLCGPEADPYPLSIALTPKPAAAPPSGRAPVAPVLAVRHASDDLCVSFKAQ
jgi:hypothetical protein